MSNIPTIIYIGTVDELNKAMLRIHCGDSKKEEVRFDKFKFTVEPV